MKAMKATSAKNRLIFLKIVLNELLTTERVGDTQSVASVSLSCFLGIQKALTHNPVKNQSK